MPNTNKKRVFQFAYKLLDANIPPHDVYQESINFIQSCNEQENHETLFIYKLTPEIMEQAAQAVSEAHSKLDETRWIFATKKQSHLKNTSEAENFILEKQP